MSSNTCDRCCKEFKFPYLLKRHCERKFPCKVVTNGSCKKESLRTTENHREPPRTTENHSEPLITNQNNRELLRTTVDHSKSLALILKENKIKCQYCNVLISKKMLKRHQRETCLSIPENLQNRLVKKYNKNQKHIKALENVKNVNSHNTNTTNNSHNNINSHNVTNNNITVKINPLGEEKTDFLKKKDIIKIINRCYVAIPDLIKTIHNRPENRNFYIPNFNKKIMAYLNNDNDIVYNEYKTVCEKIINKNISRLDNYFKGYETDLKDYIIKRMKKVIKENDDDELNDKYIDNIKFYLMNKSKKHKSELNDYINIMENEIKKNIKNY